MVQAGSNDEKTGGRKYRWTVPLRTRAKIEILYYDMFLAFFSFSTEYELNYRIVIRCRRFVE